MSNELEPGAVGLRNLLVNNNISQDKSDKPSIATKPEANSNKTLNNNEMLKVFKVPRQRTLIAAVKNLDFGLGEVESILTTDELGKDLASVQNLMEKHQLVEAGIISHEDRIR